MNNDTISLSAIRAELARKEAEVEDLRNFLQRAETLVRQISPDDKQLHLPIKPDKAHKEKHRAKTPAIPPAGATIEDRAIRVLENEGDFMGTADLTERMIADGYKPTAKGKATNTVYATLLHKYKDKHGSSRIVKVNAKWGLREWLNAGAKN